MEIWKDVVGYEGNYLVSNLGRIKSIIFAKNGKEQILKPLHGKSYDLVRLSKNKIQKTERIHRLVAEAFIPNPNNLPVVNHINMNKRDNRSDNLEWCTYQYNNRYGKPEKPAKSVKRHIQHMMKIRCVETGVVFSSQSEAARIIGVSQSSIARCFNGKQKTAGGYHWERQ